MFLLQKKKVKTKNLRNEEKNWSGGRKEARKAGREEGGLVIIVLKSNVWLISEFPSVDLLIIFPWGFLMVSWFFVCWVFLGCILDILNIMLWDMNTESCNNPLENLDWWWQWSWNFLKLKLELLALLKLEVLPSLSWNLKCYLDFQG